MLNTVRAGVLGVFLLIYPALGSTFHVVTTLKPLHGLLCDLMKGHPNQPHLICPHTLSAHEGSLRPQDVHLLRQAHFIVWMGETFQPFLKKALDTWGHKKTLALLELKNIGFFPQRRGQNWQTCDHIALSSQGYDGHVWLDPLKSIEIAKHLKTALMHHNPAYGSLYEQNFHNLSQALYNIHERLISQTKLLHNRRFFVLHDTYQYFEKRYAIQPQGGIFLSSHAPLSGKFLNALTLKIKNNPSAIILVEPQHSSSRLMGLLNKLGLQTCTLDPLGVLLPLEGNSYLQLMTQFSQNIKACFP